MRSPPWGPFFLGAISAFANDHFRAVVAGAAAWYLMEKTLSGVIGMYS